MLRTAAFALRAEPVVSALRASIGYRKESDVFKLDHPQAEQVARSIWKATACAWNLVLGGDDYPNKRALYERMKHPQPGDMVAETSGGLRSLDTAMAVGWLERIAHEPVDIEWNEEIDGPHPTERVVYITAIDGRECRWVNCEFLTVPEYPDSPGWWEIGRYLGERDGPTIDELLPQ